MRTIRSDAMDWFEWLGLAVAALLIVGAWAWGRDGGWKDGLK